MDKIKKINKSFEKKTETHKEPDYNADGSWDEHNCYVEKCEFCNEEPCICDCDIL